MSKNARMPVIFFGHGNPMNALERNTYTKAWTKIGKSIPRPRGIVCISAHWYLPATLVTAMPKPRTIHDFGGFPKPLYQVEYGAPGSPELASRVQKLLAPVAVGRDEHWGLDHGTWSILCHVYPDADIPVIQLSMDETQPSAFHFALGQRLAPLRDEQILVMGSGNLVHNLHAYAWGKHPRKPYDWAERFEQTARDLLVNGDDGPLIAYENLGRDATLSVPTPDHYLPLLYVLGLRDEKDKVTFPVQGIDGGSVSMLTIQIG